MTPGTSAADSDRRAGPAPRNPLAPLYRAVVIGLILAALLMAATFWLSLRAQWENQWVRRTLAVRYQANQVLVLVQRLESSQRGYLLTGREPYLAPFTGANAALPGALDHMAELVAADPEQRPKVERLIQICHEKLSELQSTIDARKVGDSDKALTIVNADAGMRSMDEIQQIASDIVGIENLKLASRQTATKTFAALVQVAAAVAFVALVAIGVLTSVLMRRSFAQITASRDRVLETNDALREQINRREAVETQLRQSQKMEAIGQLTGGLAHDFNNMLGAITGSLEMMSRRIQKGDFAVERYLESAAKAARRAAVLTHRLLAFARQQPLAPEAVDANKAIGSMSDLLRSTLGEHIIIESVTAGGLWSTHVDPHQLESAILNVAINARDAMPEGGRLTIETANAFLDDAYRRENPEVRPGQYVMIGITDTGAGMSADVVSKAFDPFFTTKPVGLGTGLGLSQVYGFIKQSNGHIKIYSELGTGTTIKIYLPRLFGAAANTRPSAAPDMRGGHSAERVLVVEDDPSMRRVTVEAVRELGYTAFESEGAEAALSLLAKEPVDLLLTDVMMPGMNGKKLADEAKSRHAGLKVLFMTGYTRNAVVHGGIIDAGVQFLGKPFTLEQLAAKIRETLEA